VLATWTVTTVADVASDSDLTLREAIRLANGTEGPDVIVFDLPADQSESLDPDGAGDERVFVLRLNSELPELSDVTGGTTIDGTSQTQASGDINPLGPEVVLNGAGLEFATGLVLASNSNAVRGLTIQQFSNDGIHVRGTNSSVVGNSIGTSADGRQAVPNEAGVVVFGDGNQIGSIAEPNVISGNRAEGIVIFGSNNHVIGNWIGVAADGQSPLANGLDGISISNFAFQNQIGEPAAGNTIAFNGRNGVTVAVNEEGAAGNSVRGNSLHSNAALAIDLTESSGSPDGVTANDSITVGNTVVFDQDDGANQLQNFPELSRAFAGQTLEVEGMLSSHARQMFTIDFYTSDVLDASGFGEGQRYVGSAQVQTDAAGRATIDVSLPADIAISPFVTATATDSEGNTSEFSAAVQADVARSISGVKFRDLSGNGFSDDDVPLAGVIVGLYRVLDDSETRELVASVVTPDDGSYRFVELPPAIYLVEEVIGDAFVQTAGGNGGNPFYTIDVGVESNVIDSTGNDFANFQRVAVVGTTWEDLLGDGLGATDRPRAGVTVDLFADDGDGRFDATVDERLESLVSNESGAFALLPLGPGTYFVVHRPGEGAVQTFGGDAFPDTPYVTLHIGEGEDPAPLDFGSFVLTQLAGRTSQDLTGDGFSLDDPPLPGVGITVFRDEGNGVRDSQDVISATATTDAEGRFSISGVGPGLLFVEQTVPPDFLQTAGGDAPNGFYEVVSGSAEDRTGLDFANAALPTVSGSVWDDVQPDGQVDDGEFGLAGWTVTITDETGNRVDVVTDAAGQYMASVLPGSYRIEQLVPPGWETTFPLGRFETRQAIPAGMIAGFALTADVVADAGPTEPGAPGVPDLIIAHDVESPTSTQGSLWIVRGRRNGRISDDDVAEPIRIELGVNARVRSAIAADLDEDGDLDLAVAAVGRRRTGGGPTGSVIILRNDSDGLAVHQVLPVSDARGQWNVDGPIDLTALDANSDGRMDLATVDFRSNTVSILHGVGEARFEVGQVFDSGALSPRAIAAADLDSDGREELLIAHHAADTVVVFQPDGAGGYRIAQDWTVARPADITATDLDHDGRLDIVVAGTDGVSVFWNGGGPPAAAALVLVPGQSAQSVALGDVNQDGTLDLMVALPHQSAAALLINLGERQFAPPMLFPLEGASALAGVVPHSVALADLDGDHDLDVAAGLAVGGACVLWNEPAAYEVEVNFGRSAEQLDFGNVFVGVATVPREGGERIEKLGRDDSIRTTATPDPVAVDELLGRGHDAPFDLSGDGLVSPLDALLIINRLNQPGAADDFRFDVNGDGELSPLDALLVINRLQS
jgi:hypothetical protein